MYYYYLILIIIISLLTIRITKDKVKLKEPINYLSDMEKFKDDILNGVPSEQRMRNMMDGKYMKHKK